MPDLLDIRILGVPAPQGSKRAFVIGGKARLVEAAGAKHKAWRLAVAEACYFQWTPKQPLDAAVVVEVEFYLPRPKSAKKYAVADKRPDLDKLLRSTLDGLTDAGVITDDARIIKIIAAKHLSTEWTGANVRVRNA